MSRWMSFGLALLLTACGGGGGSGSSSTASSTLMPGTYRGTASFTVSGGGNSVTQSAPVVITLSPNNTVSEISFPGSAQVVGNSFTLPVSASVLNGPGLSCPQGTLAIDGTFSGNTVSGTLSSSGVVCNGLPVTVTGNYTATLQATLVPGGHPDGMVDDLRGLVLRALTGR
jgi:hypothetical protein